MANLTREEKQDILLTLIDRMEDSIRDLKEIGRPEDAECIKDIMSQLNSELVEISDELWREDQKEHRQAIRDYYGSVICRD